MRLFVCANSKISIAMIKNNFNELGTYVSPAIKVAQLNPRRVMCQSNTYNRVGLKDWPMESDDIRNENEDWGW